MTTNVRASSLLKLAREMVYLERLARTAEARGAEAEAEVLWIRRELVQHLRSDLLREAKDSE